MIVLYRDYDSGVLTVTEVTSTLYYEEEQVLQFTGDNDFGIQLSKAEAEKLVKKLFEEEKLDLSGYTTCDVDFMFDDDDDEFDDDDEDFDEEDDEVISFFLPDEDKQKFHIPRTIRFPKKD